MWLRANGDTSEFHTEGEGVYNGSNIEFCDSKGQNTSLAICYTDSNGIIEYQVAGQTGTVNLTASVVFYLNQ